MRNKLFNEKVDEKIQTDMTLETHYGEYVDKFKE